MVNAGVVGHQVEDDTNAAIGCVSDELVEVVEASQVRIDVLVVGDVVAPVGVRRGEGRRQPERVDAELAEVIEVLDDAAEVTDAVTVAVRERPAVDVIEDGLAPPPLVVLGTAAHRRAAIARCADRR
jgi:hypothetical protein